MENSDVDLGLSNLTLSVDFSQKVNEISVVYVLANIPMLAATIVVNLWVVKVIERKEKSKLNRLIVWDCRANIVTMLLMLATHSPLLPLSSHIPCTCLVFAVYTTSWNQAGIKFELQCFHFSRKTSLIKGPKNLLVSHNLCQPAWNRLVPVGIANFRYLMVCHAVFCHNLGGEKAILDFVKIVLVFLSFSNGVFGVLGSIGITGYSFEYLRCMGRQEVFRSNRKFLSHFALNLSRYNL